MTKHLSDLTVIAPKQAVLTCQIAPGDPPAQLTWYKNGRQLDSSDTRYTYSYEQAEASLTISVTTGDDSGNYMVTASNKLRSVDTDCTLTVHGESLARVDM